MSGSSISFVVALALTIPPPVEQPARAGGRLAPVDLGDPAELAPPMIPAVTAAQRLADAGRYNEAAAAYEALWRELGDPTMVYQAGRARLRAGQNAAAARHFQTWLERASGVQDATRRYVEARRAAAQAETVRVRITASEASGGGRRPVAVDVLARAELRIEPVTAGGAPDPGAVLRLANYRGEDIMIDRVPHVVHLAIPGYLPVSMLRSGGAPDEAWDIAVSRQKVPVELRFAPEKALRGARLQVTPNDGATVGTIDQALEAPATTVMLTTGDWRIDVTARRHEARTNISVTPGMRPVQVFLHKQGGGSGGGGSERQEFKRGDVQVVILGGSFMVTLLSGLGVTLAGAVKESKARRRNEAALDEAVMATADGMGASTAQELVEESYATGSLHADMRKASRLTTAGGAVALTSVGAIVAGLTVQSRARRRAAAIEMAVGAAFVGGGAAYLAYALGRERELLERTDPDDRVSWGDLRAPAGHRAGATILVGLGAGLVVFPAVALIGDAALKRRDRRRGYSALPHQARRAVMPVLGRDHVGLAIRGQF